jgi:hypothetical protein
VLRPGVAVVCGLAAVMWAAVAATLARADSMRPTVVFFAPAQLSQEERGALEDAIGAQLSLLPATFRFEVPRRVPADVDDRLQVARQTANAYGALAVFWLEVTRNGGPWYLYAVDARGERMITRPLTSHTASPEADVEATALIVRATTEALLHGAPLPAETPRRETSLPPRAPWPVELQRLGESALRVTAAYSGSTFARQLPWEHGFALRAAWLWPTGPYVGVGYTFIPSLHFPLEPVQFNIDRYPFAIFAGLRFAFERFTFSGEIGGELEIRSRRTLAASDGFTPGPEQRKTIYNVCPKLEAEFAVVPWLVVFLNVGIDAVLGNFAYTTSNLETGEKAMILDPHWIRLTSQVGLGIIR